MDQYFLMILCVTLGLGRCELCPLDSGENPGKATGYLYSQQIAEHFLVTSLTEKETSWIFPIHSQCDGRSF